MHGSYKVIKIIVACLGERESYLCGSPGFFTQISSTDKIITHAKTMHIFM